MRSLIRNHSAPIALLVAGALYCAEPATPDVSSHTIAQPSTLAQVNTETDSEVIARARLRTEYVLSTTTDISSVSVNAFTAIRMREFSSTEWLKDLVTCTYSTNSSLVQVLFESRFLKNRLYQVASTYEATKITKPMNRLCSQIRLNALKESSVFVQHFENRA